MRPSWRGVAAAAAILAAPAASAHELVCEKTVDGMDVAHVFTYPTTVTYDWKITNVASVTSIATGITDSMFDVDPPFTVPLPIAEFVAHTQPLEIPSYARCAELAGATPNGPVTLTNTLTVTFDGGTAQCDAQVICHPPEEEDGEGCLTRTPGYWSTHPDITAEFLSVTSCGRTLSSTEAGASGSITEDLCSIGKDHKLYGSPQEAQLVRQCAAAALNIAASESELLGGSCEEALSAERFAECCTSCGGSGAEIAASGCIEDLDAFNNSKDTLLDEGKEINLCHALGLPCSADPGECKEASGNGIVNAVDSAALATVMSAGGPATPEPVSGGCSGGPGGWMALLGALGALALRRRG